MTASRLGSASSGKGYSPDELREIVEQNQSLKALGRLSEAAANLLSVVESSRFSLIAKEPEGRAALYTLGDAFAELGSAALARAYLLRACNGPESEGVVRASLRRLTELALESARFEQGIEDLTPLIAKMKGDELKGELEYLKGRKLESEGDLFGAGKAYAAILPVSRFWSTSTYRRGLLAVNLHRLSDAEGLFCQVADPKRSNPAGVFADERFYAVRDLARLALGRVAHEGKRTDDARYYYYLVPQDSKRLAESLYESATSRYEGGDLEGARELLDELKSVGEGHVYDDEGKVLDVYVDIAACKFDDAQKKLDQFLTTFVPLRDRVHALATGRSESIAGFLEAGSTTESATADADARIFRRLEADPALLMVLRERRRLASQLSSLKATRATLGELEGALAGKKIAPALSDDSLKASRLDLAEKLRSAILGLETELAALEKAGAKPAEVTALKAELARLEGKARGLSAAREELDSAPKTEEGDSLPLTLKRETREATLLHARGEILLAELDAAGRALAREALIRLDKRASRLVARARLAKIDVVLGRKKGLELEVDALRQGILPKDALDAVDAARFLSDKEEYWPFEGDEWVDEVIGLEVGER